jgi:hypothetical protein
MKHTLIIAMMLTAALSLTACKQPAQQTAEAPATPTPFERAAADEAFLRAEVEKFITAGLEEVNAKAVEFDGKIQHLNFPVASDDGLEPMVLDYLTQMRFRYSLKEVLVVGYGEVLAEPFHGIAVVEVTVVRRVAGQSSPPIIGVKTTARALPLPLIHPDLELPADSDMLTDELRARQAQLLIAPEETLTDTFLIQVTYIASEEAWVVANTDFPQSWMPFVPQAPGEMPAE